MEVKISAAAAERIASKGNEITMVMQAKMC
jgi:hypothetical protein